MLSVCVRCEKEKPSEDFYPHSGKRNGLSSWCRACHSEHRKKRYAENRDHELQRNRRWEIANPDKTQEKSRRLYAKHRDKRLANSRAWHAANPERKRELWNDWAKKNPDKIRERTLIRAARHNAAAGMATPEQIAGRIAMYGGSCWMCGEPATALDHVIPLATGGSNWPANLRPACKPCNSRKHARDWRKFVSQLSRR